MPSWRYINPVKIYFGPGRLSDLKSLVGNVTSVLITTPGFTRRGVVDFIRRELGASLLAVSDEVRQNPNFESVKRAYQDLRRYSPDLILALGGGSAIDTAKAVAAISETGEDTWTDEHLKKGAPFPTRFHPKPIIAIPTTAGSGSEVTMWATIWDTVQKKKFSLSHPLLYPQWALLDPELTLSLPEKETIYSSVDAMSHAMETIWNKNHNPVSDTFALNAISLIYDHLPLAKKELTDLRLRTFLLQASLMAGLAVSNTKTALAHSISYPLTTYFGLPHGLACALPLRHLLLFNGEHNFDRIKIMAKSLRAEEDLEDMEKRLNGFFEAVGIASSLSDYGIEKKELPLIVKSAITPERAGNNIVNAGSTDLMRLIEKLF
jgi:alcohol dehydrogenase